jgi:2-iminobutanoate/2-iminopropanoate deaminase
MTTREILGMDPVEPYAKIVMAGDLVYVKSQIGRDEAGELPEDIEAQTRNTLEHLAHALEMADSDMARAVKLQVYLADIDSDFAGMNAACRAFFADRGITEPPARTTIGAPLSWPALLVQMDIVAVLAA